MISNIFPAGLLVATGLTLASAAIASPVSLDSLASTYQQNFDALANAVGTTTNTALPTGWAISEAGDGARRNDQYAVDSGGSNTGDLYSYGAAGSPERALGGLRSGALVPLFGIAFFNHTGSTITALDIAFTGEQWRLGSASRIDRLAFQYSTDASDLLTGTYISFSALDFLAPNTSDTGALLGNATANSSFMQESITGLAIAPNSSFWLRWVDFNADGADDGLAIDDFSLRVRGVDSPASTVPEPGSLALASLALLALMTRRSRQEAR